MCVCVCPSICCRSVGPLVGWSVARFLFSKFLHRTSQKTICKPKELITQTHKHKSTHAYKHTHSHTNTHIKRLFSDYWSRADLLLVLPKMGEKGQKWLHNSAVNLVYSFKQFFPCIKIPLIPATFIYILLLWLKSTRSAKFVKLSFIEIEARSW